LDTKKTITTNIKLLENLSNKTNTTNKYQKRLGTVKIPDEVNILNQSLGNYMYRKNSQRRFNTKEYQDKNNKKLNKTIGLNQNDLVIASEMTSAMSPMNQSLNESRVDRYNQHKIMSQQG